MLLLCLAAAAFAATGSAQTLARPGWVGSGITPQTWWRRAVFYQLDKDTQITKDEIASLEAFGVDALVLPVEGMALPPETAPNNTAATQPLSVDDLFSECSRQHMRVLVTINMAALNSTDEGRARARQIMALSRRGRFRAVASQPHTCRYAR